MAAAPYGSALILPISYAYISMMGSEGLTEVRAALLLLTLALTSASARDQWEPSACRALQEQSRSVLCMHNLSTGLPCVSFWF